MNTIIVGKPYLAYLQGKPTRKRRMFWRIAEQIDSTTFKATLMCLNMHDYTRHNITCYFKLKDGKWCGEGCNLFESVLDLDGSLEAAQTN